LETGMNRSTIKNRAARRLEARKKSPYVTQVEAAEYLGVTDRTIRQMIADGRLKAYDLGPRVVRLRLDEIDAAMKPYGGVA
jgi:excisionase family DNA binding protein